jgi:hypothetical protein
VERSNLEHENLFPSVVIHKKGYPVGLPNNALAAARAIPGYDAPSMLSTTQLPARKGSNAAPLFSFPFIKKHISAECLKFQTWR